MPALPFSPKIQYGAGPTTLLFTQSQGSWTPERVIQGGSSESAAGIPETFVIRKDSLLKTVLIFKESEYATVVAWLDWVMDNGSAGFFTFWPDQNVPGTSYSAWLIEPKPGAPWGITRHRTHLGMLQLDVTLRVRTANTLFNIPLTGT